MRIKPLFTVATAMLILSAGAALAEQERNQPADGNQPAAKQSAPAESSHASGHDAQAGQPETGPNAGKTKGEASDAYKAAQDKDKEKK